ncbi:hypothetical protein FNV43_RR06594 [Rhamnella rubrinervis]|uniref:Uncharacterized protein n=1 Tax=Rhamnella rubrinervis TaxID=2594499 RepID=A0A8K0HEU6_9ROSA|nr:hypothetical protein FNV43_RR06594 [Rhamnella rubrinervis]
MTQAPSRQYRRDPDDLFRTTTGGRAAGVHPTAQRHEGRNNGLPDAAAGNAFKPFCYRTKIYDYMVRRNRELHASAQGPQLRYPEEEIELDMQRRAKEGESDLRSLDEQPPSIPLSESINGFCSKRRKPWKNTSSNKQRVEVLRSSIQDMEACTAVTQRIGGLCRQHTSVHETRDEVRTRDNGNFGRYHIFKHIGSNGDHPKSQNRAAPLAGYDGNEPLKADNHASAKKERDANGKDDGGRRSSAYNMILGTTLVDSMKAIPSTYHQDQVSGSG